MKYPSPLLPLLLLFLLSIKAFAFDVRGFHIDLRSQVMTLPALKAFAQELSEMKINTLVMEWEATFPYDQHATITNRLAYKPGEVREFIAFCGSIGIEVIPLHHCFGHAEWFLRHDRYRHLSEDKKEVSQVCPLKDEAAVRAFREMFAELAAYHPSNYFHIGCDETYLLGSCRECQAKVVREGKSKLFVDYVKQMCQIVTEMGKIPVLWADIIIKYPEAIAEIPKETIFVDWNYGWKVNYFGDMNRLYDAGITFWGAPSLRSSPDNMHLTKWTTHFNNQRDFIPYGRQANYKGMIMTSWSTSGLYSFMYDQSWEIQDMEQVRNVYPLNGFRILVAAYARSLEQDAPLDPPAFVEEYAQARFGLSPSEGKVLWQVLNEPQEMILKGRTSKGRSIEEALRAAEASRRLLERLSAKRNRVELDHLRLMFDLRINYLKFKMIEAVYQSDSFSRERAQALFDSLRPVIRDAESLDRRFARLQRGFISDYEIKQQNAIRKRKMYVVRESLKAQIE